MKLHQAQKEIAKNNHRFRVLNCGRRFGKTTLAVEEIKGKALSKSCHIAYIAPTYPQARDIAWEMLKKELKPIILNVNESRLELKVRTQDDGETMIWLRGWESIESLRGQQFDFIVIDEVAMMRLFKTRFEEIVRPTLTDTMGDVMFISTPKGFNHFYDLYNKEAKDKDYKSFHFSSYDNPFLPVEELDKAKVELPEDRFAQEYMADFRKTEGVVYKEFNRDFDVVDKLPDPFRLKNTILGIDFGYNNESAILKIKVDTDHVFWIVDEWYKQKQTTDQIAEKAQGMEAQYAYPDPAEPDRIEILRSKGINCREVNKEIAAGIDYVRELFNQRRIKILRDKCPNLIWELETYHYPEDKREKNESELPVKDCDHAVDALRYALYSYRPTTGGAFNNTNKAKKYV